MISEFVDILKSHPEIALFLVLALGYAGGPQFFANLDAMGLRMGLLCLIEVVAVIALVVSASRFFGFDQGTAAGLIAIVVVTSQVFPLLLRINLREEADKLRRSMGGNNEDGDATMAAPEMVGRVFDVTAGQGRTVGELMDPFKRRVGIERLQRGGLLLEVTSSLRLEAGDRVLVVGQRGAMVGVPGLVGPERADVGDFDAVMETAEVMLTQPEWFDRELRDLIYSARSMFGSVYEVATSKPSLPMSFNSSRA